MPPIQIAIYGAGGFAREVTWLVESCKEAGIPYEPVCLINDDKQGHGQSLNGVPVYGLEQARQSFPEARIVGGVGSPAIREKVMLRAEAAGFKAATVIHPSVLKSKWIEVGEGTVICAGNILTTNIRLGRHVQINLACTIGHDVVLDDYATLAPGVHVSGWVHIGKRAYIGTGANIINGTADRPLIIGDDAIIGAGACVIRPVEPGQTVVGVPAKPR
jgi:sugar O-acyltransferase (sialic acid O-acetyltransferase NeuD family)